MFRLHNVMPSEFYRMGYGEKAVIAAFLDYEIGERNDALTPTATPTPTETSNDDVADIEWLK